MTITDLDTCFIDMKEFIEFINVYYEISDDFLYQLLYSDLTPDWKKEIIKTRLPDEEETSRYPLVVYCKYIIKSRDPLKLLNEETSFACKPECFPGLSKETVGSICNLIGDCYNYGFGDVKRNFKKRLNWYTRGVQLGNSNSAYNISMIYYLQSDFTSSIEKSKRLYTWLDITEKMGNKNVYILFANYYKRVGNIRLENEYYLKVYNSGKLFSKDLSCDEYIDKHAARLVINTLENKIKKLEQEKRVDISTLKFMLECGRSETGVPIKNVNK